MARSLASLACRTRIAAPVPAGRAKARRLAALLRKLLQHGCRVCAQGIPARMLLTHSAQLLKDDGCVAPTCAMRACSSSTCFAASQVVVLALAGQPLLQPPQLDLFRVAGIVARAAGRQRQGLHWVREWLIVQSRQHQRNGSARAAQLPVNARVNGIQRLHIPRSCARACRKHSTLPTASREQRVLSHSPAVIASVPASPLPVAG